MQKTFSSSSVSNYEMILAFFAFDHTCVRTRLRIMRSMTYARFFRSEQRKYFLLFFCTFLPKRDLLPLGILLMFVVWYLSISTLLPILRAYSLNSLGFSFFLLDKMHSKQSLYYLHSKGSFFLSTSSLMTSRIC